MGVVDGVSCEQNGLKDSSSLKGASATKPQLISAREHVGLEFLHLTGFKRTWKFKFFKMQKVLVKKISVWAKGKKSTPVPW